LAELGLRDAVLSLLASDSQKAREYAIEYARGHAADMPAARLAELLETVRHNDTRAFAAQLLGSRPARVLGVAMLARLLGDSATNAWAKSALEGEFDRREIGEDLLVDLVLSPRELKSEWARAYLSAKFQKGELPAAFWVRILDDPRFEDAHW